MPFSSDHVIIEALRERSQPLNSSDFAVVPYYQGALARARCDQCCAELSSGCYFNYVNENTYKKLADTVAFAETQIPLSETTLASNIVVPFTHDVRLVHHYLSSFAEPGHSGAAARAGGLATKRCSRAIRLRR